MLRRGEGFREAELRECGLGAGRNDEDVLIAASKAFISLSG